MSKIRRQEAGPASRKAAGKYVHVQIDELVLDGFGSADRSGIAEGVKSELIRLIGRHGADQTRPHANATAIDAGAFAVGPGANAAAIGRRVAQAVHRELMGGRRSK